MHYALIIHHMHNNLVVLYSLLCPFCGILHEKIEPVVHSSNTYIHTYRCLNISIASFTKF